jgi:hypothetical protein
VVFAVERTRLALMSSALCTPVSLRSACDGESVLDDTELTRVVGVEANEGVAAVGRMVEEVGEVKLDSEVGSSRGGR